MATVAVAGVIGAGAFATAAVVGPDGEINACYEKKSGDLDVLKGKKCGKGEKTITWAQEGPPGPQGPQGEAGGPGSPGTNGTPGASGVAGPTIISSAMPTDDGHQPPGSGVNVGNDASARVPVPPGSSYTAKSFVAATSSNVAVANVTIRLNINGVPTALTCTINVGQNQCGATGATVVVPEGALISMETTNNAGSTPSFVGYAFRAEF
jgi:hypothetical protein